MTKKQKVTALVLGSVLAAAGDLTINRVGGSALEQSGLFALACVFLIAAGAVARWGNDNPGLRLRIADAEGQPRQLGDVKLGELGVHWSRATPMATDRMWRGTLIGSWTRR